MTVRASVLPRGATPDVQRVIEASQSDRRQENLTPFASGQQVVVELVAAGSKTVQHSLKTIPRGYLVLSVKKAIPAFYLESSSRTDLKFYSDNDAEVTLWVF